MDQGNAVRRARDEASERLAEDDWISRLPNDVIHHIFSFMDTRFAVQTGSLSSWWRHVWKSYPCLDFHHLANQASTDAFNNFVHRFLSDRGNGVELPTIDFRSNCIALPLLMETIDYAMSHRTRDLNVEFLGLKQTKCGGILLCLFRSVFLRRLSLIIDFKLYCCPNMSWDFPALTTMHLERVSFEDDIFTAGTAGSVELFSNLPNLRTLALVGCSSTFKVFVVASSRLEDLTLIDFCYVSEFVISAPRLSSFTYIGMARFQLSAIDVRSLERVNFQTVRARPLRKQQPRCELMINTLNQLSNARFLTLNANTLRFLSAFPQLLATQRCPFARLQNLTLVEHTWPSLLTMFRDVVAYFRRGSPSLAITVVHDQPRRTVRRTNRVFRNV